MTWHVFWHAVSLVGAFLLLGAYFAVVRGALFTGGRTYAGLNFAGATCLAAVAITHGSPGLILVEVAWALISLPRLIHPEPPPGPEPDPEGP